MSHLPKTPAALTANGSHPSQEPAGPIEGADASAGTSRPPSLLQEVAWFLRDYAETLDDTPHPRLDGIRRDVDAALEQPTSVLVRAVAEAIYIEVDRGMARQLGINPDTDRRYGFDELTDGVKLVYRRAALKAIEAVEQGAGIMLPWVEPDLSGERAFLAWAMKEYATGGKERCCKAFDTRSWDFKVSEPFERFGKRWVKMIHPFGDLFIEADDA